MEPFKPRDRQRDCRCRWHLVSCWGRCGGGGGGGGGGRRRRRRHHRRRRRRCRRRHCVVVDVGITDDPVVRLTSNPLLIHHQNQRQC